jgi:hypothetical protein
LSNKIYSKAFPALFKTILHFKEQYSFFFLKENFNNTIPF